MPQTPLDGEHAKHALSVLHTVCLATPKLSAMALQQAL